ncbi:hypothetical protein [Qipengyuania citrea]|nr:hypothetical protein [Qipengyuania citrea]
MIDNIVFLAGAYAALAAGLGAGVGRVSPSIGPRLRHAFAGIAPLAAVLGMKLTEADSVTLHGVDLAAGGGLVVLGIAASVMAAKALPAAGRAAPAEDCLPIG